MIHLRHSVRGVGVPRQELFGRLADVLCEFRVGRQLRSTPHVDGTIRIWDTHVIGDYVRQQIRRHDWGCVEVRPHRVILVIRLLSYRHVRDRRVARTVFYGDVEGGFQRRLVPAWERSSRPRHFEMRCGQPPTTFQRHDNERILTAFPAVRNIRQSVWKTRLQMRDS